MVTIRKLDPDINFFTQFSPFMDTPPTVARELSSCSEVQTLAAAQ
jgi:hypothetical protein